MIFSIYTNCSSTYKSGKFMSLFPFNKDELNIFLLE